jgi:hypothetical protein
VNANASTDLVLIHSPLVGSAFFEPLAVELRRRGWTCHAPTARRDPAEEVRWSDWPDGLRDALSDVHGAILVGHSAAGMLLPALAQKVRASGLIFVDATIPPAAGSTPPVEAGFMKFVRELPAIDGRLPRWSEWWGKGAIAALMPDERTLQGFEEDLPRLSLDWFADAVETPAWAGLRAGYIQLSARFAETAADARARGWPVVAVQGTHLHPLLAPVETADAIEAVVKELER